MSTKPRKLASIEKGLTEIVKVLNESEIKSAIKKGSSYVRKCSDPNPDETGIKRHIKHWESIELDKVCLKKGISPPLLSSHQFKQLIIFGDSPPELIIITRVSFST